MATINSKNFALQSQSVDQVILAEATQALATPYTVRLGRVLPKSVKGSVLRGNTKFTRVYLDADNRPCQAVITISSSIPNDAPSPVVAELQADVKADIGAAGGVTFPCIFTGKIY